METCFDRFEISDDKARISLDRVCDLMKATYWASQRSRETVEKSIENSICLGVYDRDYMVGFARIVTDHATMYWLCDVIIDEGYRGAGLGKRLIGYITEMDELKGLLGILATRDAHSLYEKYGFRRDPERFMRRDRS